MPSFVINKFLFQLHGDFILYFDNAVPDCLANNNGIIKLNFSLKVNKKIMYLRYEKNVWKEQNAIFSIYTVLFISRNVCISEEMDCAIEFSLHLFRRFIEAFDRF